MLFSRSQPSLRTITRSATSSNGNGNGNGVICLNEAFAQLGIQSPRANGLALGKGVGAGLGAVRHSTHKAQGAVNKAKDGPGKRLGAKKSGGMFRPSRQFGRLKDKLQGESMLTRHRAIRYSRQHHFPPARHALVPRRQLCYGTRPHNLCYRARLRKILQGSKAQPKEAVYRSCIRAESGFTSPAQSAAQTAAQHGG